MQFRSYILSLLLLLILSPAAAQDSRVDTILAGMTLEQKVAQMFMVSFYGTELLEVERDFLQTWQPGAVVLFARNVGTPPAVTRLTNSYQQTMLETGGIPLLIAVDQEGGIIAHLDDGFTTWPVPMLLTATGDADLAYRVGGALAQELRAVGITMNLAPVADLHTNPLNPIIGRRSFGTDGAMVAPILSAVIRGMQDGGVLATAKHFPGHGDTDSDSHLGLPVVTHDSERLHTVELMPFGVAIDADVGVIMTAHIWFPALEPQTNMPASFSHRIVTGLLRDEMGYDGLIMTDALDMDAIDTTYSMGQASIMAIQAGNDIITIGAHVSIEVMRDAMQTVVNAVRRGDIPESRIDESVRRILDAKADYGLLDWQPLDPSTADVRVGMADHAAIVDEMFQTGTTLVFDSDLIPLSATQSVALIYPATRPSIRQACRPHSDNIRFVGVSQTPTQGEIAWAANVSSQVDVTVVFTLNAIDDRAQQRLVQSVSSEQTIVVALWSPYDVLAFPDVSTYITTYSPLPQALPVSCGVLFGQFAAMGRLPVTISPQLPAGTGLMTPN